MGDAKRGACLSRNERANEDAVRNGLERAGSRSLSVGFEDSRAPALVLFLFLFLCFERASEMRITRFLFEHFKPRSR